MSKASVGPARTLLTIENLVLEIQGNAILRGIDISVNGGTITALAGPNGAGKSSVIKSICGYHRGARAATFTVNGQDISLPGHPRTIHQAGLRVVHQDLGLIDSFSTFDNVLLGQIDLVSSSLVRRREWGLEVQKTVESFGGSFDVHTPVGELRPYERVIAAVARAAYGPPNVPPMSVLVMDEVTAALPANEIAVLLNHMREVARSGIAVIFVTHHFDEILELADSVIVIRDGMVAADVETASLTMDALTHLVFDSPLTGGSLSTGTPGFRESSGSSAVLTATNLEGRRVQPTNLSLAQGRIYGITGRVGSGKSELGRLLAGVQKPTGGRVDVAGRDVTTLAASEAARTISYVPQDRERHGVIREMTLSENLHLGQTVLASDEGPASRLWRERRIRAADTRLLKANGVVPASPGTLIRTLSGGNQQKIVFLRALGNNPPVLIVDEPTIGVDLVSRAHLHTMMRGAADAGATVLVISSDAQELLEVADHIAIVTNGAIGTWISSATLTLAETEGLIAAGSKPIAREKELADE